MCLDMTLFTIYKIKIVFFLLKHTVLQYMCIIFMGKRNATIKNRQLLTNFKNIFKL